MTLKFNRVRAVVKVHVRAKYHQAECSGSWVIALTEKNSDKNNTVRRYRADSKNSVKRARRLKVIKFSRLSLTYV